MLVKEIFLKVVLRYGCCIPCQNTLIWVGRKSKVEQGGFHFLKLDIVKKGGMNNVFSENGCLDDVIRGIVGRFVVRLPCSGLF